MSIPLDRLYHYLGDVCSDDIIIYRWAPHGSKKLKDLCPLVNTPTINSDEWVQLMITPTVIFHDQEPLKFDLYSDDEIKDLQDYVSSTRFLGHVPHFKNMFSDMHPYRVATHNALGACDKLILCHSEKNSKELKKFEDNEFIGAYYWSHAVIARDWFRYAEHDPTFIPQEKYQFDFLIYNRAWSGTREYRLKFCELLVENNLTSQCKTSLAYRDNGIHYSEHQFSNKLFQLNTNNLEKHYFENLTESCYSADYESQDYNNCGLEVVLETLFDDDRNHLTEKSLRPIACKKAFILASTPFSLEYLRSYGFKTFNGLIDETYDTIIDPVQRLEAIVKELSRISSLPELEKIKLWDKLNLIAEHNQTIFFSEQFHNTIITEFKINMSDALAKMNSYGKYWKLWFSDDLVIENTKIDDKRKFINDYIDRRTKS